MMFKKQKLIKVLCFFIPIFQIYNLQRGKEDLKNRLKSAAEIRKSIDDAFNVFLATKKSVQEMCSEEVKESIDNDVNAILQRIVVNDHIDDILKEIEAFNDCLKKYFTVLGELEEFPPIGKKKLRELLHPPNPVTDQEKVMMTLALWLQDINSRALDFLLVLSQSKGVSLIFFSNHWCYFLNNFE